MDEGDEDYRGVMILGLDAPEECLKAGFAAAADVPLVKGFAVGRTIFGEPAAQWFQGVLDDEQLVEKVKQIT
ncbi:2-deoxy-5-keto-D-gluconate 6-phosphate aldolase domain-containing protein [Martelella alba]|uniref:2-deoxy-5-keto-D-gluconate 6-phosphate aldolase domain-containing protein n=1 Tax=Martelella alba TaxID=2590451 RepID=UPI001E4C74CA|nr:DUF2090 domain-containing protein [Martelella alba]